MPGLTEYVVWFAFIEDGDWFVESDQYQAATGEEALAMCKEDYPGCQQYSLKELSV
jgi:hypothetical protein